MNALTDQQLLREYTASRSESAFRELVRRHIDLVHSAARRLVRDSHLAEDVTQAVFTALSKDARKVSSHPVLAGWLHRTTRHLSTNVIRADARRRLREQQVIAMNEQVASGSESELLWADIASHLDAVLGELSESDRDAVLLRYFEKRSAKEIATALGITAEAAQKRVNRAIERLRESFARRGVTGSGASLTAAIGNHAVQAAPSGLAATVVAGVLASSAATTTTTTAMIVLQKMLVPAAVVALAGTWLYQNKEAARLRAEIAPALQAQAVKLRGAGGGAGVAGVTTCPSEATSGAGAVAGNEDSPDGGGDADAGFLVGAGVMIDGEWHGAGGPEPVSLDKQGRPTTDVVERLELTDDEVAALEAAVRRVRDEAAADFISRVKFVRTERRDDGLHYLYEAPARPDRGQHFLDSFAKAFTNALGENRGQRFREEMDENSFLGGMGKFNLEFDFRSHPEEWGAVAGYTSREPGSTEQWGSYNGTLEDFVQSFGDVFEFPAGENAPKPRMPVRRRPLPNSR